MKSAGIGVGLIGTVVLLGWLGSGFFIVQEGQQAVVTTFGRYSHTVDAGFQWRAALSLPGPRDRGRDAAALGGGRPVRGAGHRPARLVDADAGREHRRHPLHGAVPAQATPAYLFENPPRRGGGQAAESAVREIVGRSKVDSVLYEQRDASPPTWSSPSSRSSTA
jgi:membrane protease subunit HflK